MSKLLLRLDDLQVETFEPCANPMARGTVLGRGGTEETESGEPGQCTCVETCPTNTCTVDDSCKDSCDCTRESCVDTCEETCGLSRPPGCAR